MAKRNERQTMRQSSSRPGPAAGSLDEAYEAYFELHRRPLTGGGSAFTKPGVAYFPELHPAVGLLRPAELASRRLLDLTASAGAVAALVAPRTAAGAETRPKGSASPPAELLVLEPSRAAWTCAQATVEAAGLEALVQLQAGLPWDAPAAAFESLVLAPPADRGNLRVEAELQAGLRALLPGGEAWLVVHKDRGAKRYERRAAELFGELTVVRRERGWRLSRLRRTAGRSEDLDDPVAPPWLSFEAGGLALVGLPGVFAVGRTDPGTALLVGALELGRLAGSSVLDLGCGYGLLGLLAARAGAAVTAVDDDLAAVRSTRENASRLGLALEAVHSDIDRDLPPQMCFDAVLCNPPFHVGKQVRLEVPAAFLAAAARRLQPGGTLWLVANKDLPYERWLASWARCDEVARDAAFKVLRAVR